MTDRIPTAAPDTDRVEHALRRITSTVALLKGLAVAEAQHGDREFGDALDMMADDLEEARDVLRPLPAYIIATGRAAA